ncbi:MAG: hypothetical protein LJE69_13135 [Thiohalocapsa sp.]|jgi:hypothetical protein|uniref:hypothetical protein n=1 Tax=Thiohalocapsa sp. TaxID=2497641 RepID=UPI0025CDDB39|nr:hypothetical protein [Thiohalocapsa sp.]MCG6942182.1 hypothetical protein [Thiohalocapsa sp.]
MIKSIPTLAPTLIVALLLALLFAAGSTFAGDGSSCGKDKKGDDSGSAAVMTPAQPLG